MKFFEEQELQNMIEKAASEIKSHGWKTFAISTKIPEQWLILEEKEWDAKLDSKCQSIKNSLNAKIVKLLATSTVIGYDPTAPEGRVVFDLSSKSVSIEFEPIFIFGRYKKLEAGLSQSRWICQKCEGDGCFKCDWKGKYYISVEELIGDEFKKECKSSNYALHASGREDVDVVNTAGRPFVLELIKPKNREIDINAIAERINSEKKVEITDLRLVPRSFVEVVTESHFEKEYEAEVEFGREVTKEEIEKLLALSGQILNQRTPKRVAHRRADLDRKRKVISVQLVSHSGNKAAFSILAEAGTYIKELVNGDNGRTVPSFSSVMGCEAKCTNLKVTKIYDEFLDFIS
jgi:tRNA pseudouridine synthase 10